MFHVYDKDIVLYYVVEAMVYSKRNLGYIMVIFFVNIKL